MVTRASDPPAVIFPVQPTEPHSLAPYARLVRGGAARRLWIGQSLMLETHLAVAYLAGTGLRIPMGTGVTLMPMRHPLEAAAQARTLASLTSHPFVAGFGAATPGFVAAVRGTPYDRPATAAADYAADVRRLLSAGTCGAGDVQLPPLAHPPVEVGLGVVRPRMARLAGAVADVLVTWMTPAPYVRDVLVPAMRAGAAGRDRSPRIATVVHFAVAKPHRDPRALALAVVRGHLTAAHYTDMLRRAGIPADPADPEAGAAAFVDAGGYVFGSPREIADRVRFHRECGVDEVILNPGGVAVTEGHRAAVDDLTEVLAAVGG